MSMKLDRSFSKLSTQAAINKIVKLICKDFNSAIILRSDEPAIEYEIRSFFSQHPDCYLIKLGSVSRLPSHIYYELSLQLDKSFKVPCDSYLYSTLTELSDKIRCLPAPAIIVIDNFHLFITRYSFKLIRMIRALDRIAFFIFLLPNNADFHKWKAKINRGDPYLFYFLKVVNKIYVLRDY